MMLNWKNLDTLASYEELKKVESVNVAEAMSGENGAERVKNYSIPMMDGLTYNYAAKAVDDKVLAALAKLAGEAQLIEKYESLYNGAVINTGENRLVLHQLTRGQLGDDVVAEGVNKREFYVAQQQKSLILQTKYMQARSQMQQARNLQPLFRSVSAEVI